MSSGQLLRSIRRRRGLSQARLALRAGTDQAAISRIERDEVAPSTETLGRLLAAMGENLSLGSQPMARDYDPLHMRANLERPIEHRLALALGWNRLADQLARAGAKARNE